MNEREVRELRRRFRPDKENFMSVYGCYVNESRQVISMFEQPLIGVPREETEKYLGLLKKSLSGNLGKNLIDIEFSNQQVLDSDEHRMLSLLRSTGLKDEEARKLFFERVIASLSIEGNYLILLAHDVYTVPYRAKDDTIVKDGSDEEFEYIVCSICPVKQTEPALSYYSMENRFHSSTKGWVVSAPELGFVFPAFDDRSTNLYGALYYTKSASDSHKDFVDGIFHTEPPMPAAAQRETFESLLTGVLGKECSLEVLECVHEQLNERIEEHKENKEIEPLTVTKAELGSILSVSGVSEEKVAAFTEAFDAQFGEDAALPPTNVIDAKRFEISTPDVTIKVAPGRSGLVETRVIDGRSYILIAVSEGVEVNGVPVELPKK